jgi:hypothetical protein
LFSFFPFILLTVHLLLLAGLRFVRQEARISR